MDNQELIEKVYEIAFGDDAIHRDYTPEEVVDRLRTFSDQSHFLEETAAPMLKIIHQEGSEDWWEADLDEAVEELDNLGV
jgi:hypothetical protein